MDIYYIFSIANTNPKTSATIVGSTSVVLNERQSLRLFGTDFLSGKSLTLYEISPKKADKCAKVLGGRYFNDCNKEVYELLSKDDSLFGFPSQHLNLLLKTILSVEKDGKISLLGDDGWSSLKSLFKTLNEASLNYVVLRKFESLPQSFLENDHDIDLLCEDIDEMIFVTGATKRSIGISGYQLIVNGEKIDFDIRFVGDKYFDSQWARMILSSRNINAKGISVMDDENQFFSILYHCLTQKKSISEYYINKIQSLGQSVFGGRLKTSADTLCAMLAMYMKTKSYAYVKPLDASVVQNKKNIKTLTKQLNKTSRKAEFIRKLYIKTPHKIRNRIPEKKRQKLYKI